MSKTRRKYRRVLALDVRPQRFGYASFEDGVLIDCGVDRFTSSQHAARRVSTLLMNLPAGTIVLRKMAPGSGRNRFLTKLAVRAVCRVARHVSIHTVFVSERRLREHFAEHGAHTKHEIACFLAQAFPELGFWLRPRRRPWEQESWGMAIFDAVALGIGYIGEPSMEQRISSETNVG